MIRIRCSYLESFRRVIETEYGREDELIRSIRGEHVPPNWMMQAGTAWHALLSGQYDEDDEPEYSFDDAAAIDARAIIGPGLWEVPGSIEILPGVSLEGTADHLRGLLVTDNKTKFTTSDSRDYEASLQWRCYLLIHGGDAFRYCLWRMADPTKDGHVKLKEVLAFHFYPYPEMESEVRGWVQRFLSWAETHNLLQHLERDPYIKAAMA